MRRFDRHRGRAARPGNVPHGSGPFTLTWLSAVGALASLAAATSAQAGDGSFKPAPDLSTDANPGSIAVADFNSDGHEDLAVTNFGDDKVTVRLGKGGGNFMAAADVSAGSQPISIAVADFNGDGNEDFAVADDGAGVSVRLGKGDGTFTSAADLNAGAIPVSIAVGDFNGDGNADLAVGNNGGVSVRLGKGDGTFTNAADVSTSATPNSIAVGDFNSDGHEDLALANDGGGVSVRLGQGDGSFTSAPDVTSGATPISIAVGDFNSDGHEDLAVANNGGDNASVRLGKGDGSFTSAANVSAGTRPSSVAVGDFNSDGNEDLAIANNGGGVSVRLGRGNGGFTSAADVSAGTRPIPVAVGDFNSDGNEDLAIANNGGGVSVRLGRGKAPLAGNLLANGGFEAGVGAGLYTRTSSIPGWQRPAAQASGMRVARYGIPPHYIFPTLIDSPRYRTGGLNLLWGGYSAPSGGVTSAFQTVDVSGSASAIEAGRAKATLSAYLGGASVFGDTMTVTATFLGGAGAKLGTLRIGPVSAADRHDLTTLLRRAGSVRVPPRTRRIRVTLTALDADKSYSSAFADNVKLTLALPAPVISALTLAPSSFRAASTGPAVSMPSQGKPKRGTNVRYSVSLAGSTRFTVLRLAPGRRVGGRCVRPTKLNANAKRCTRHVALGGFGQPSLAGKNRLHFSGRLAGNKLAPGTYLLRAVPKNVEGRIGKALARSFAIVR
jgi:hypothetical protein